MRAVNRPALLVLVVAAGCLPQVGPPVDAGVGVGGGGGATATGGGGGDGGSGSVGCSDGSKNGTETDVDCGGACAPCPTGGDCLSALDCASGLCASGVCATPGSSCGAAFAGCGAFVDLTDAGTPSIRFPVGGNNRYSPNCLRVRFGQSVVFEGGDFGTHILAQGCGPVSGVIGASSGQRFTVTFNRALGVYGYYCTQHGSPSGSGMAGAIEVVR